MRINPDKSWFKRFRMKPLSRVVDGADVMYRPEVRIIKRQAPCPGCGEIMTIKLRDAYPVYSERIQITAALHCACGWQGELKFEEVEGETA